MEPVRDVCTLYILRHYNNIIIPVTHTYTHTYTEERYVHDEICLPNACTAISRNSLYTHREYQRELIGIRANSIQILSYKIILWRVYRTLGNEFIRVCDVWNYCNFGQRYVRYVCKHHGINVSSSQTYTWYVVVMLYSWL